MKSGEVKHLDYVKSLRREIGSRKIILNCAGVLIVKDGMILFQRRSDNCLWGLVGGLLELDETYEAAAIREAREETGLAVRLTAFLGIFHNYDMMWSNDNYYFTAYDDREKEVHIYRADRVDNLEILDVPAMVKPIDYKVENYHSKVFSMYMGPMYEVELLCENDLMNSILDRFGETVYTRVIDKKHFLVRTTVALSDLFFGWVFSSAGKMKIVSPESVVELFHSKLNSFL